MLFVSCQVRKAGIKFITNVDVGKNIKAEQILKNHDSVILACGASNPRDIKILEREAKGIYFAVDFLQSYLKIRKIPLDKIIKMIYIRILIKTNTRGCTGFDRLIEDGEAIRMRCVKWQN